MAATRTVLKQYFKKYATPTEEQFAALIDAFVHKDEDSLTQSKIDGLTAALESKVSSSDLQTAVEAAVAETLQGGNLEVTPAAHEHAVSDISGLGARLTTLETSKADYEAFKALVTAFLNDADVQDTTINRWKELEDFLNGITDSDTLTGMLQALKAEILAEVPQPQTGNYLEQVTNLDTYTDAQNGKIVQYVGETNEKYHRGMFYEAEIFNVQRGSVCTDFPENDYGITPGRYYLFYTSNDYVTVPATRVKDGSSTTRDGQPSVLINSDGVCLEANELMPKISNGTYLDFSGVVMPSGDYWSFDSSTEEFSVAIWQPLVTSPVVS